MTTEVNEPTETEALSKELFRTREAYLKSVVETTRAMFGSNVCLVFNGLAVTTGDQLDTWKNSVNVLNELIAKREAESVKVEE